DGDRNRPEPPRVLFTAPDLTFSPFDVAADGRFLMVTQGTAPTRHITIVTNWLEELRRLVPPGR
ncbi:MAG: hypothetical protein R3344_10475, partial [Acidobacteriota bacterium]|nr:hypothetical protein [Acidobacteriota bacterium]